MKQVPTLIHVPTPGDHYSLATGSATMSVIHELTRRHLAAGGKARIIVGRSTRHDIGDGECVPVDYPGGRSRLEKIADVGRGWMGMARRSERELYRPAAEAIEASFDGSILLYNSPGVVGMFKEMRPQAQVCLYAVNALFRTYSRAEIRRTVAAADRILCCSQFIANDLIARLGAASPKIKVVHNGVDSQKFQPAATAEQDGAAKILFIGRAVRQKGPDLLLKAAKLLRGKTRPFKLRLVGSRGFGATSELSAYERELRNLAEPLGDCVEFCASISRDKLLEEYQAASIFCAPSNWDDPFPLTVLEAMACGLPTVASRRGGIPEGGAEEILYFSPPDVEELAERLAQFIDDPRGRRQWSIRSRARAEHFDWQNQYAVLRQALAA
jgi:glycosyltransferase involved in cell wall biosynthesis